MSLVGTRRPGVGAHAPDTFPEPAPIDLDRPRVLDDYGRTPRSGRRPRGLVAFRCGAVFGISRIAVLSAASLSSFLLRFLGPGPALNRTVGDGLGRWDGVWYLRVADWGYPHHVTTTAADIRGTTTSFFPLYPLLIRTLHALTGLSTLRCALAVANVAGLMGAILVWHLVARRWGDSAGYRACALFCFFPGSFIFSLAYAEALMIALVLATILALEQERWLIAGVAAALSTAARPNALPVVLCCGWAAGVAVIRRHEWRAVVAPVIAPLGFVGFCSFLWQRTGSWSAWFTVERFVWRERIDPAATWHRLVLFWHRPWQDIDITIFVIALAFTVGATVQMWRVRPPVVWWIWSAGVVGLAAVSATLGLRPRFLISAFPLVVVGARDLRGTAFTAVLSLSAGLLVLLTVVDLTGLFVP